jgi:hypothetical protein
VEGSQTNECFIFFGDLSMHCECVLLAALDPMESVVGYIGLSKLSCSYCFKYFAAYRKATNKSFHTRGTDGDEQELWAYPALPGVTAEAEIRAQLCSDLTVESVSSYE